MRIKNILLFFCIVLFACNTSKKVATNSIAKNTQQQNTNIPMNNLLQNGIDFFAQGNKPSNWQLTINYDDTVRFNADDGLTLKFAYHQLKKQVSDDSSVLSVQLKSGLVKIIIFKKTCSIPTITTVFKNEVTVAFNTIIYKGCGSFLANEQLNNTWTLEKIDNNTINSNDYNLVPVMEFDLANGTVKGNDGCNSINGKVQVQGKRIQFYPLISTKKGCSKKSIEKIISTLINNQIVGYYFKEGKLYLYLPDDSLLVFRKA